MVRENSRWKKAGACFVTAAFLLTVVVTGGCQSAAQKRKAAELARLSAYAGLKHHSVAVVVYADDATLFMYPQAAKEVSSFLDYDLKRAVPSARILNYRDVINYQNQTPNWQALPIKAIGLHFSVDRVIYLELLNYSTHAPGAEHLLQGHIKARVYVYDTHLPGDGRVLTTTVSTRWPRSAPEPVYHGDTNVVRMNTLTAFSAILTHELTHWDTSGQNGSIRAARELKNEN